ncbi:LAMI_0D01288g1_1 [Lachancea mirantina]|uniref:LAMI_0D01288g1_1 n=1 Tax=Lachancea mirantina TaxID=1230905 RepID=A0A1G4J8M1_9SACH|nr:LAMI_0D01288g1_1 [Lachancea mirantina]
MSTIPVAIITGASRGIGRAIVEKFASQGVCCVMVASKMQSFEAIRKALPPIVTGGQWHRGIAIDLNEWPSWADAENFEGFHREANAGLGELHQTQKVSLFEYPHKLYQLRALVNCAGITQTSVSLRTTAEETAALMKVNFLSAVTMCNMAARRMIRSRKHFPDAQPCIVNVSSVLGLPDTTPAPGTAVYSASKAALEQYSRVLAAELQPLGIRVASIEPGLVAGTDMVKNLDDSAQKRLANKLQSPAKVTPEAIAQQVWQEVFGSGAERRRIAGGRALGG